MKIKLFNTTIIIGSIFYDINEYKDKNNFCISFIPIIINTEKLNNNILISITSTIFTLKLGIMIIIS